MIWHFCVKTVAIIFKLYAK